MTARSRVEMETAGILPKGEAPHGTPRHQVGPRQSGADGGACSRYADFAPSDKGRVYGWATADPRAQREAMVDLANIACLRDLPGPARDRLTRAGYAVDPADGARICAQGDPADAVYAVIGGNGWVRIGSTDGRGKTFMAELSRVGDIFGEIGVLCGLARSADAVAEGQVHLWRIAGVAFRAELDRTPALGVALSYLLAKRLRRTFSLLENTTFAPMEARLAHQLLYLASLSGKSIAQGIRLQGQFRQGDLADLLGATTRSIITILHNWRASGMIEYDTNAAQVTICQMDALRKIADGLHGSPAIPLPPDHSKRSPDGALASFGGQIATSPTNRGGTS